MKLIEYMRKLDNKNKELFLKIFTQINEESSFILSKQINDRMKKLRFKIEHSQKREAILKDKLMVVNEALTLVKNNIDLEEFQVLEGWRDEILRMLNKIDYKDLEIKCRELNELKNKIKSRAPIVNLILEEFNKDVNSTK
jgi:hypothetical protein